MNYMLHVTSNYRSSDYQHINLKGGNFNVVNNYILDCIVCCFDRQEHYRYNLDTQKEITRIVWKGGDTLKLSILYHKTNNLSSLF